MTGDTVLHRPVRRLAQQLRPDVLLMHLGAVRFPQTGPLRYPMNSADALRLIDLAEPRVAVPLHSKGGHTSASRNSIFAPRWRRHLSPEKTS